MLRTITRNDFTLMLDHDARLRGLTLLRGERLVADGFALRSGGADVTAPALEGVTETPDGVILSLAANGAAIEWELRFGGGFFDDRVILTCPKDASPDGFFLLLTCPAAGAGFMRVPMGDPNEKPRVLGADELGEGGEWEGVTFSRGGEGLCVAKHPSDLRPVWISLRKIGGKLLFGGAAYVSRFGIAPPREENADGTRVDFRFTRYMLFEGGAEEGFRFYREFMRENGVTLPANYDPPTNYCVFYESWFLAPPEIGECHGMDFDFLTGKMADYASALRCGLIYLDQGWDKVFGSLEWDEPRLRKPAELVSALREKGLGLGALIAMHVQGDCLPESVYMRGEDGSVIAGDPWHPIGVCPCSDEYKQLRYERLKYLADSGLRFFSYDFMNLEIPCWSREHDHPAPSDAYYGTMALVEGQERLKAECPGLLIESHDWYSSGGCYYPIYCFGASHHERWGFEYMWKPLEDYANGRVQNLYWYNLAYDKPLYLHMDLTGAGDKAEVFWFYASLIRHLGVGSYGNLDDAHKKLMRDATAVYAELKPFFTRGAFDGHGPTAHIHTLKGEGAVVCLFAEAEDRAGEEFFTAAELGLERVSEARLLWGDAEVEASEGGVRITPKFEGDGAVVIRVR